MAQLFTLGTALLRPERVAAQKTYLAHYPANKMPDYGLKVRFEICPRAERDLDLFTATSLPYLYQKAAQEIGEGMAREGKRVERDVRSRVFENIQKLHHTNCPRQLAAAMRHVHGVWRERFRQENIGDVDLKVLMKAEDMMS